MLENLAGVLAIAATAFGVLMSFANFPQTMKIIKKKSCSDVSLMTYIILFPGVLVWVLYGISISNIPIIITNFLSLLSVISVIVVYYIYRR
jgi:MtN3 and saliva related transmembrane protein